MSITIDSDLPHNIINKTEPCLCSQMAEGWTDYYQGKRTPEIEKNLKLEANPNCPFCKGEGIEVVGYEDTPSLQLSNRNANALFKILGINLFGKEGMVGEMTIPEARRAIMRSQSRKNVSQFVLPEKNLYGKPREISPGVIDLKPLRFFEPALTEEQLKDYIKRFAEFVIKVSRLGATKIMWH